MMTKLTQHWFPTKAWAKRFFLVKVEGIESRQAWHYPSRHECLFCHTEKGGFALVFNSGQLNCDIPSGTNLVNQIGASTGRQGLDGWVKLARQGQWILGFTSSDGVNWQFLDSVTIALGTNVAAGLAVTSGQRPALQVVNFQNVSLLALTISVASSRPFLASAASALQVQLAGDASQVTKVEFFANANKVGEATSAPYTL